MTKKYTIIAALAGGIAAATGAYFLLGTSISATGPLGAPGLVSENFKTGALSEPITEVDCTLSDGTKTTCYKVTITGIPVDTKIGPFCPETTTTSAEDAGIWLDGSKIYDVDGKFILDLGTIYGDAKWKLYRDDGKVNVTDTKEAFQGAAKPDVEEAYKYHCVEGKYEWTNTGKAVPITTLIPKIPMAAPSSAVTIGADLGVALNGLVISGSAPVDAILGAYTIAAFDDCGGHFNPIEGYHLHAYTDCQGSTYGSQIDDPNAETKVIGYAMDGVAVFAPLAHDSTIKLDECNGRTTTKDGYHYYAQSPELNKIVKCFKGLTAVDDNQPAGPPAGGNGGPPPGASSNAAGSTSNYWAIIASGVVGALFAGGARALFSRKKSRRSSEDA